MTNKDALQIRLQEILKKGDNPTLPTPARWNPEMKLLPFQRVGASFMAANQRFILGDPTGVGKTPQALRAYAIVENTRPLRLLMVTPKAVTGQMCEEIQKFLPGTKTFEVPSQDSRGNGVKREKRYEVYKNWRVS